MDNCGYKYSHGDRGEKMIIYLATNKVNEKKYVGMTTRNLQDRKWNHKTNANDQTRTENNHFSNAIRKYGWEAFEWEEIDNAMFLEDLQEKEKYWINHYDTYHNGYNSTIGGEGSYGAEGLKGENNPTAKITEKQALDAIDLLFAGEMSIREIAKVTKVSPAIINAISCGHSWTHLYKGDCPAKAGRKPVLRPCKGENHGNAIVSETQVIEVKRLLSLKIPMTEISAITNIPYGTIDTIKRGQCWGWLKTEYDEKISVRKQTRLNEEQVKEIKKLLKQGKRQFEIEKLLHISRQTISLISLNKIWKHVTID